jgi:hypothetical protein
MNKKIIVMYAGYIDWSSYKVFDSMYGVLKHFQDEWDMPELTLDEIKNIDWQKESEIKIVEADYYSCDDGSIGEELLSNIPEIEEKCRAVRQAVAEKYFSLDEALEIYKVTSEEYGDFLLNYTKPKQ